LKKKTWGTGVDVKKKGVQERGENLLKKLRKNRGGKAWRGRGAKSTDKKNKNRIILGYK